jgi:hypothetical protein
MLYATQQYNTTGTYNTAIGRNAALLNNTYRIIHNTAIGRLRYALCYNTTGSNTTQQ